MKINALIICKVTVIFALVLFGGLNWNNSADAGNWKKGGWKTSKTTEDLGKAENNYQLYCAPCHGSSGDGRGDLAGSLTVPPRDHTDAAIMSKRTDEHIFKTISEGGVANGFDENMPPHNTVISKQEIDDLVKYIRKLCNCQYAK